MLRSAILAALLAATSPLAVAGTESAKQFVADATRAVAADAGTDLAQSVLERVDTARVARFTLGRHVRDFNDEELARFEAAFAGFLESQLRDSAQMLSGAEVEIISSTERREGDAIVTSRVKMPGEGPQTVRWRALNRDGQWRIIDVEVAGLWLAVEQRAQFNTILERRGATIEDAIASLRG
jgi:phospholipid transport system substrate-binding protein